jgi:hypothetical protein
VIFISPRIYRIALATLVIITIGGAYAAESSENEEAE